MVVNKHVIQVFNIELLTLQVYWTMNAPPSIHVYVIGTRLQGTIQFSVPVIKAIAGRRRGQPGVVTVSDVQSGHDGWQCHVCSAVGRGLKLGPLCWLHTWKRCRKWRGSRQTDQTKRKQAKQPKQSKQDKRNKRERNKTENTKQHKANWKAKADQGGLLPPLHPSVLPRLHPSTPPSLHLSNPPSTGAKCPKTHSNDLSSLNPVQLYMLCSWGRNPEEP